jgi:hypothetical protein
MVKFWLLSLSFYTTQKHYQPGSPFSNLGRDEREEKPYYYVFSLFFLVVVVTRTGRLKNSGRTKKEDPKLDRLMLPV